MRYNIKLTEASSSGRAVDELMLSEFDIQVLKSALYDYIEGAARHLLAAEEAAERVAHWLEKK